MAKDYGGIGKTSYFANRTERKRRAEAWENAIEANFPYIQAKCKFETLDFDNLGLKTGLVREARINRTRIVDMTTQEAIWKIYHGDLAFRDIGICFDEKNQRLAALNFASFKNPGGMYMGGSSAQEESLCHYSNLYSALKNRDDYYRANRYLLHDGVYATRGLYTPDAYFFNPNDEDIQNCNINPDIDMAICDVITLAAPNHKAAINHGVDEETLHYAMVDRIDAIISVAAQMNVNILILGAYGCGVFGWDPEEVADIFFDRITILPQSLSIDGFIFAIPAGSNKDAFEKVRDQYMAIFNDKLNSQKRFC